ncbi:MAG: SDR family oxidoreductase [Acidobacteriota bacterium]|nr:SDR family oxidoreductase [Acidobacteriota bacterium]
MSIRFDGRVVVITGAGSGLGKGYALQLAMRGARVVVNDRGGNVEGEGASNVPAQFVVDEIKRAGGEAVPNFDDVSQVGGANNLIEQALDQFGTVDVLICNAGILRDKSFLKMPLEDFELVLRVHLLGTVYVTRAAFPVMKDQGYGRIVMTTSASGLYGNFGQTNYAAAKLGIVGFMNSLKLEALKYDVLINTIAPLAVTRLGAAAFPDELASALKPEFITPAVAYLCSEQCRTTGDIISAGGGWYRKVQMVEGRGVKIEFESQATPEMIATNFGAITLMEGARPFANAQEEFASILTPWHD